MVDRIQEFGFAGTGRKFNYAVGCVYPSIRVSGNNPNLAKIYSNITTKKVANKEKRKSVCCSYEHLSHIFLWFIYLVINCKAEPTVSQ